MLIVLLHETAIISCFDHPAVSIASMHSTTVAFFDIAEINASWSALLFLSSDPEKSTYNVVFRINCVGK